MKRTTTIALAIVVVLAVAGASAAVVSANGLTVSIDQNETGEAIVEVTDDDVPVENATVNVTVDENASADRNVTYEGVGEYETDANGTVLLEAPDEPVSVNVTVHADNRTATTTTTLEADTIESTAPFGQQLQQFMDRMDDHDRPWGHMVSDWVTEHNPGNASEHARNATDCVGNATECVGNASEWNASEHQWNASERGPNAHDRDERGPPEHAGGPHADERGERGPPEHAGGSNGNGNR